MTKQIEYGVAWYVPGQWKKLKEVSSDSLQLEATYEEWISNAEKSIAELESKGMIIQRVNIEIDELVEWSKANNIQIDGKARSQFAAIKLEELDRNK